MKQVLHPPDQGMQGGDLQSFAPTCIESEDSDRKERVPQLWTVHHPLPQPIDDHPIGVLHLPLQLRVVWRPKNMLHMQLL